MRPVRSPDADRSAVSGSWRGVHSSNSSNSDSSCSGRSSIVYGELVVLGYNGCLPNASAGGRLGSKFVLRQRPKANGVKPERKHVITSPTGSKALDPKCHSVSYTMSRSESVVVEYGPDECSDMFQVGRSSEAPIDFVIADAPPSHPASASASVSNGGSGRPRSPSERASAAPDPMLPRRPVPKPRTRSANESAPLASDRGRAQLAVGPPAASPSPAAVARRGSPAAAASAAGAVDSNGSGARTRQPAAAAAAADPVAPGRAVAGRLPTASAAHWQPAVPDGARMVAPAPRDAPVTAAFAEQRSLRPLSSTISRFACRVVVSRRPPHTARIYAAGFDSSNRIALGEKATKWSYDGEFDGLTTNGVRLLRPPTSGNCFDKPVKNGEHIGDATASKWREVSVCGRIFAPQDGSPASTANSKVLPDPDGNVLYDGTLIDLCGATLMWRSAAGLKLTMQAADLEDYIGTINRARPQCPVGLNTLVLPQRLSSAGGSSVDASPYVYLRCGHVHGAHAWLGGTQQQQQHQQAAAAARPGVRDLEAVPSSASTEEGASRTCPLCLQIGPFAKLQMGCEPSLYVDRGPPTHCFVPCAHMTSEMSAKYWAAIALPFLSSSAESFSPQCPFCNARLPSDGSRYTRLVFQDQAGS